MTETNPRSLVEEAGEIPAVKYECESLVIDLLQFSDDLYKLNSPVFYIDLDHTADVQLHSWGADLKEAFEQVAMSMFGYMTELEAVDILEKHEIEAHSEDLDGLLYRFLDELLFLFSAEPFLICKKLVITELNLEKFIAKCSCYGEPFDLKKHPQGTEVKAITYSSMQIVQNEKEGKVDVFVIIDI